MLEAKYDWRLPTQTDNNEIEDLSSRLAISSIVTRILYKRGYKTVDQINSFLHPSSEKIIDPFELYDMDKAIECIQEAAFSGLKIVVYGDYDVDGLTSTAVMYSTLMQLGADVTYYIPNRFEDGYGPNIEAYKRLIDKGAQLIVTVDNGVTGYEAINYAKSRGVKVVVTDHHELPGKLPEAYAIVHPRHPKGKYPFGGLSGVGVAFKVATALLEEIPSDMLDLVALGTVADVVPLISENRILVKYGLEILQRGNRLGVKSLCEVSGTKLDEITEQTIGFILAPRLNSLGRLGDANVGVELLTTENENTALSLANSCQKLNSERQELVEKITENALEHLKEQPGKHLVNLVWGENWHQGVLGIVASRLVDKTGKPTVVVGIDSSNNIAKGSGRSIPSFNLFQALDGHRDKMVAFGGHHMACGLSVEPDKLEELQMILDAEAKEQQLDKRSKESLELAGKISLNSISTKLIDELQLLAPFGNENEEPVFAFDEYTTINAQAIGKNKQHLKINLASLNEKNNVSALAFSVGEKIAKIVAKPACVKFIGTLSKNVWRDKISVQVMIKDMCLMEDSKTEIIDMRTNKLRKSLFQQDGMYIFFNSNVKQQIEEYLPQNAEAIVAKDIVKTLKAKDVTFVDCPNNLNDLKRVLTMIETEKIYTIFFSNDNAYLVGVPSREQFATLFKFIQKHTNVDIRNNLDKLAKYLKISKELLIFMIQVFFEAGFVKIENGLMSKVAQVKKEDLSQTRNFKMRQLKMKAQQVLIYSNRATLTKWLTDFINI